MILKQGGAVLLRLLSKKTRKKKSASLPSHTKKNQILEETWLPLLVVSIIFAAAY